MSRLLSFSVFLAILLAVLGGMHFYIWARLVRDPGLPEAWRRLLTVALVAAAVGVPAGMFWTRLGSRPLPRIVPYAVYGWLGLAFLLFSALLAIDVVRLLGTAAAWAQEAVRRLPGPPPDPSRRLFVARVAAGGAMLAAGGSASAAVRNAVGEPEVSEVAIRLPRLPAALSGLTVAQISDLHVGPTIRGHEVRRVVEETNRIRADVVVITGDLVDGSVPELRAAIGELARLESRYGVYFVTGNHEYYSGVGPWIEELRRLGIRTLRNERVSIGDRSAGGASIDLAGTDDWRSRGLAPGHHGPDLARALAGRDAERGLVLLQHQPHGMSEAVRSGVGLQLSGHTHGGQLFPFTLLVSGVYRYSRGLYLHREEGAEGHIFVSRGTGYWGPPMRLGAPPEIAKIVLT